MSDSQRYPSLPPKTLAVDLSSTDLVLKITDKKDWNGNDFTSAYFPTDYIKVTLQNDTKTKVEFMLLDPATIGNITTTGATILVRGLKTYAEGNSTDNVTGGNAQAWTAGETKVMLGTNPPNLYGTFANKGNDETIDGKWIFPAGGNADAPVSGTVYSAPTDDLEYASKKYVDDTAIAGSPAATNLTAGIVKMATDSQAFYGYPDTDGTYYFVATMNQQKNGSHEQRTNSFQYGETIAYGELVYLKAADSKWYKASATAAATADSTFGICAQAGVLNDYGMVMLSGSQIDGMTGLTVGVQYLSDTAGAISATPGTYKKVVGYAPTTTSLFFIPVQRVDDLAGGNSDATTANFNAVMSQYADTESLSTIIAGETISGDAAPKSIYIDTGIYVPVVQAQQTTVDTTSSAYGTNWLGQNFIATKNTISDCIVECKAVGSPAGNLVASIYATDGSGFPTGAALGSVNITASTIGVGGLLLGYFAKATFSPAVTVTVGTKYALVLSVPSGDGSNYVAWQRNSAGGYADGIAITSANSGSTWSNGTGDMSFKVYGYDSGILGRAYLSDSTDINKCKSDGFAVSNATAGNSLDYVCSGIVKTFSGLTAGTEYFLSTAGAVSATPSPLSFGTASATTMLAANKKIGTTPIIAFQTTTQSSGTSTSATGSVNILSRVAGKALGTNGSFSLYGSFLNGGTGGGTTGGIITFGGSTILTINQSAGTTAYFNITVQNTSASTQRIFGWYYVNTNYTQIFAATSIDTTTSKELLLVLDSSSGGGGTCSASATLSAYYS